MSPPPIIVVFGTRPEAVKLAPVVLGLRSRGLRTVLVSTGQHRDLVQDVLDAFGLRADQDLAMMREDQTLDDVLMGSLAGIGRLLDDQRPSAVVVQGDTTSALAAGIAAFHRGFRVAHVEAGLRSGRLDQPFPEEMNRRALSTFAHWHFAPTAQAVENLRLAGVTSNVHCFGNTVVDALHHLQSQGHPLPDAIAARIGGRPYILATAHRRESWGVPIREIARGLREVLERHPHLALVFVTHPNPRARSPVSDQLGGVEGAIVVDALDYGAFVTLLDGAVLAVTDSGGVQEEAPTLGVPVLVTREVTERGEGIAAGAALLVGTRAEAIAEAASRVIESDELRGRMSRAGQHLYGDGRAGELISDVLQRELAPGVQAPQEATPA